ncbi:sigma-70 family RNA polymerase sigma factor [Streptomyces sp. CA-111067]|uniref:sigma-70 family RNA polymerase sigma factor n=1 Tax=Streptomyces sp. CA-111067 TaxID=3240046 RepID=UPI003D97B578
MAPERNPEEAQQAPRTLTDDQAERILAEMNEVIRAGEEMRKQRAEMISILVGLGWTQDRIARLTEMSQPAVSKHVAKYRASGDPLPPMGLGLDQYDVPWLEGRLWGLAEEIAANVPAGSASCTPFLDAVARGRTRFTPRHVDELRRLVEDDLLRHRARLGGSYRTAYDEISRRLDVPAKPARNAPAQAPENAPAQGTPQQPRETAAVRRTLARRLQRDRLTAT